MSLETDLAHHAKTLLSTKNIDFIKELLFVRFKYKLDTNESLYNVENMKITMSDQFYNKVYDYQWQAKCSAANYYRDGVKADEFLAQAMFLSMNPAIPILNKFFMDFFEFTMDERSAIQAIIAKLVSLYPRMRLHESEYAWCIAHNPSNEIFIRLVAAQTVKDCSEMWRRTLTCHAPPDMMPILLDEPKDFYTDAVEPDWAKR